MRGDPYGEDDVFEAESDDSDERWRRRLLPRSSNVTELDLVFSSVPMNEWILACKALKSFRIHGVYAYECDLLARDFNKSLSVHKSTLEYLWVETDFDLGDLGDSSDWMGTFIEFTALKFICSQFPMLVGFDESGRPRRKLRDVLPCSLETLFLSLDVPLKDDDSFMEAIVQLVELTKAEGFPNLKVIYFEYGRADSELPDEMAKLEWLKKKCEEADKSLFIHRFGGGWDFEDGNSWLFGWMRDQEASKLCIFGD